MDRHAHRDSPGLRRSRSALRHRRAPVSARDAADCTARCVRRRRTSTRDDVHRQSRKVVTRLRRAVRTASHTGRSGSWDAPLADGRRPCPVTIELETRKWLAGCPSGRGTARVVVRTGYAPRRNRRGHARRSPPRSPRSGATRSACRQMGRNRGCDSDRRGRRRCRPGMSYPSSAARHHSTQDRAMLRRCRRSMRRAPSPVARPRPIQER